MTMSAISFQEFGRMLRSCCPPNGWAVAHSGGADSTCLLYLLRGWLSQQYEQYEQESPPGLLSLSVDHSLQSGSSTMAENCRQFCENLQIPFQMLRIPWSHPPFPHRPGKGGPIETIARLARFRLLLDAMKNNHTSVIAMGHHADDHVETLLMRLVRNPFTTTPMGMRNCRRWGMGSSPKHLDWAGSSGMHHWVVRPLLDVSKDRILATCELHKLHYIDDPTNFQPWLTPRNFVRYCLSQQNSGWQAGSTEYNVAKVKQAINQLDAIAAENPQTSREDPLVARLRSAAKFISHRQQKVDEHVSQYLLDFTKPSPPSTLLLLPYLEGSSTPVPEVQRALILRILRFVSPRPWGTPDSEASRRSSSLRRIFSRLWDPDLKSKQTFCAGGEVMWRPVSLKADGCIRLVHDDHTPCERQGWLASRQPPIKRTGALSPCVLDISGLLNSHGTLEELLWDNRFVITLRPRLLPAEILDRCVTQGSVLIVPHGRWFLPKIVWVRPGKKEVVLAGVDLDGQELLPQSPDSAWAGFCWIRSLKVI